MKKLTTVFAILAMTTSLGLAGCKKKKDEENKDTPAAKMTDDKMAPAGGAAAAAPAGSAAPAAGSAAPAAGSGAAPAAAAGGGDLPPECQDYKATIEKLAACDKMPQASKDALKQGYDAMSQGWGNISAMPPEAKAALGPGCKTAADALKQTGQAVCGW